MAVQLVASLSKALSSGPARLRLVAWLGCVSWIAIEGSLVTRDGVVSKRVTRIGNDKVIH